MRKKYLVPSLLLTSVVTAAVSISTTFAAYKAVANISQTTGYQGKLDQESIFFNANIWELDGALFFICNNYTQKWIAPSKVINPTINGTTFTLYVFILENPSRVASADNNTLAFMRINPDGENVPVDGQAVGNNFVSDYFTSTPQTVWNQTDNFAYDQRYNYYIIPTNGWTSGKHDHNGEDNSGCQQNILGLDSNDKLEFISGVGDVDVTSVN